MDVDTTSQRLQAINILNNAYAESIILEGELSSAEMQAAVGKNYGKLLFTFDNFRNMLKKNFPKTKTKPKRQATLTDMFSRASRSK